MDEVLGGAARGTSAVSTRRHRDMTAGAARTTRSSWAPGPRAAPRRFCWPRAASAVLVLDRAAIPAAEDVRGVPEPGDGADPRPARRARRGRSRRRRAASWDDDHRAGWRANRRHVPTTGRWRGYRDHALAIPRTAFDRILTIGSGRPARSFASESASPISSWMAVGSPASRPAMPRAGPYARARTGDRRRRPPLRGRPTARARVGASAPANGAS